MGIVFGALLLVGATWFVWKLKKKRSIAAKIQSANVASGQPYLYTQKKPFEADTNEGPYEADTNQIHELHESYGIPAYELQESVRRVPTER